MKNLIKDLFGRENSAQAGLKINLIKTKNTIRKALLESAQKGHVVGVYCPSLNPGMLLVDIDDFSMTDKEPVIIFKSQELNGIALPRNKVALSEIRSVCVFDMAYEAVVVK